MQELLLDWGRHHGFCQQYPWQVFAFVLVTALVVFDLTRRIALAATISADLILAMGRLRR